MQDRIEKEFAYAREEALIATTAVQELAEAEVEYLRENSGHVEMVDADGWLVWTYRLRDDVPLRVRRLAREALFCARHALDHATNATMRVLTGSDAGKGGFPLAVNNTDLHGRLTKLGIDSSFWQIFRAARLYSACQEGEDTLPDMSKIAKFAGSAKHRLAIGIAPDATIEFFHFETRPGFREGEFESCDLKWDAQKREAQIVRYPPHVRVVTAAVGATLTLKIDDSELDLVRSLRYFAQKATFVTGRLAKACHDWAEGHPE